MHVSDMSTRTSRYGDITLPISAFLVLSKTLILDRTLARTHSNVITVIICIQYRCNDMIDSFPIS